MEFTVRAPGLLGWTDHEIRCALGRAGITRDKREGDGATPAGRFPFRRVLYRPDRMAAPPTALPCKPIDSLDGWCDDPADAAYNRQVRLPHAARHEVLWRDDHLYDLIVVLGHNDDPPVAGLGSAIFLHVAAPDYAPTEGCVAVATGDLIAILANAGSDCVLSIES